MIAIKRSPHIPLCCGRDPIFCLFVDTTRSESSHKIRAEGQCALVAPQFRTYTRSFFTLSTSCSRGTTGHPQLRPCPTIEKPRNNTAIMNVVIARVAPQATGMEGKSARRAESCAHLVVISLMDVHTQMGDVRFLSLYNRGTVSHGHAIFVIRSVVITRN